MERGTKSGGGRRLNGEMKLNHDESSSSVSGIITYTFSTYVSRLYICMRISRLITEIVETILTW